MALVTHRGGAQNATEHTYEEIRRVAIDILSKREAVPYEPDQFSNLNVGIAHVFNQREGTSSSGTTPRLSEHDASIYQEVFWDLFRQGITTIGLNPSNANFPFFRVSSFGQRLLDNPSEYFFTMYRAMKQ